MERAKAEDSFAGQPTHSAGSASLRQPRVRTTKARSRIEGWDRRDAEDGPGGLWPLPHFLRTAGLLDPQAFPASRPTPERLSAFVSELERDVAPVTVRNRITNLGEALRVKAPEADPAGLVDDEHGGRPRLDGGADLGEVSGHQLCVAQGHEDAGALALPRADRLENVGELRALGVRGRGGVCRFAQRRVILFLWPTRAHGPRHDGGLNFSLAPVRRAVHAGAGAVGHEKVERHADQQREQHDRRAIMLG